MTVLRAVLSCSLLLPPAALSCSRGEPEPLVGRAATPPPATPVRAPMVLTLAGPAEVRVGGEIEVTLVIERVTPDETPIDLTVSVPEGARLLSGNTEERLVDATSTRLTRRLRLALDRVPEAALTVVASAVRPGAGVTARRSYSFGRSVPSRAAEVEARRGEPVVAHGRAIARPVVLSPRR